MRKLGLLFAGTHALPSRGRCASAPPFGSAQPGAGAPGARLGMSPTEKQALSCANAPLPVSANLCSSEPDPQSDTAPAPDQPRPRPNPARSAINGDLPQ